MEERNDVLGMLDLMLRPGFCVEDGRIVKVNQAAQGLCIRPGWEIAPLLKTGAEEYAALGGSTLYLTLTLAGEELGASVVRMGRVDVFTLEQEADNRELKAMALAAQQLRCPLSSVMATAQQLFPLQALQQDSQAQAQISRLNRGLYQLLRVLGNMSDAAQQSCQDSQQTRELGSFLEEVFEKAQSYLPPLGLTLVYQGPREPVYGCICADQLERAVLNILSNAIKFTPRGGSIRATAQRQGGFLRLSIQDSGCGISDELRGSLFTRYQRQPGMEDSRFGLGLGMVLIRKAAAAHGGVVLIDQPEATGTRVTLTIDLRRKPEPDLRCRVFTVDYAGNLDHWLVELADSLPPDIYAGE